MTNAVSVVMLVVIDSKGSMSVVCESVDYIFIYVRKGYFHWDI